jgi:hypothetical protein
VCRYALLETTDTLQGSFSGAWQPIVGRERLSYRLRAVVSVLVSPSNALPFAGAESPANPTEHGPLQDDAFLSELRLVEGVKFLEKTR